MQSPSGSLVKYIICQAGLFVKCEKPTLLKQERLNIYPKIYSLIADILYHLRNSLAIGTCFRWLLFLYLNTERKMILWQQLRNFRQVHGDVRVYSHTEEIMQPDGTIKKKRIYKSFTSDIPGPKGKRLCERTAADWAANKERYTEHEDLTVGQAISSYIQSKTHVLSESTLTGYKVIQKNYLTDITNERLSLLTTIKVQKWVNSLSSTVSVKTVKNAYGLFNAAVSSFSDLHFKINFPQKKQENIYIPSDKDIKTLLLNSKDDLQIAIYLGAFAGLRRGEICALEDADVLNGYIRINKSMGKTERNG